MTDSFDRLGRHPEGREYPIVTPQEIGVLNQTILDMLVDDLSESNGIIRGYILPDGERLRFSALRAPAIRVGPDTITERWATLTHLGKPYRIEGYDSEVRRQLSWSIRIDEPIFIEHDGWKFSVREQVMPIRPNGAINNVIPPPYIAGVPYETDTPTRDVYELISSDLSFIIASKDKPSIQIEPPA